MLYIMAFNVLNTQNAILEAKYTYLLSNFNYKIYDSTKKHLYFYLTQLCNLKVLLANDIYTGRHHLF